MTKIKTSFRLKKGGEIYPHDASKDLRDEKLIAQAFWECLKDNDPEGAIDMIVTYLEEMHKFKLSQEKETSRPTINRGIRRKNLTLKSVAKALHSLA